MPATVTAESNFSGLSGVALKDAVKALLLASGATIVDEYSVSSNRYIVTQETAHGMSFFAQWRVDTTIYNPAIFTGWNAASHTGTDQVVGLQQGTTAFTGGNTAVRMIAGPGYRFMHGVATTGFTSGTCCGWLAPVNRPAGYAAARPWVAAFVSPLPGNSSVLIPSLTGTSIWSSGGGTPPPVPDPNLGTFLTPPAPLLGPDWQLYAYPDDFMWLAGRTAADFTALYDSEYTLTVAGQARTYRVLGYANSLSIPLVVRTA